MKPEFNLSPTTTLSRMSDRSSYEELDSLVEFLANQLRHGRLALVLGAGASFGFGLPSWDELIQRLCRDCGASNPPKGKAELQAEKLFVDYYHRDRVKFAAAVRKALYEELDLSLDTLQRNPLLSAIGALSMASNRGSVGVVVSYNFDDLVERYLRYFGHDVESVDHAPSWSSRATVRVLHPHGLLPSDSKVAVTKPIVLTQADYDAQTGMTTNEWRSAMRAIFISHTCIFIGLSGKDQSLTSLLKETKANHVSQTDGDLYWGVRFDLAGDENEFIWEERGVFHSPLDNYERLPEILFRICQEATKLHTADRPR